MVDFYTQRQVLLGAADSSLTGGLYWSGDNFITNVSWQTSTASASRLTILGSNEEGMRDRSLVSTASPNVPQNGWEILMVLTAQGISTITAGPRWITAFRDGISVSASSNATVTIAGRV